MEILWLWVYKNAEVIFHPHLHQIIPLLWNTVVRTKRAIRSLRSINKLLLCTAYPTSRHDPEQVPSLSFWREVLLRFSRIRKHNRRPSAYATGGPNACKATKQKNITEKQIKTPLVPYGRGRKRYYEQVRVVHYRKPPCFDLCAFGDEESASMSTQNSPQARQGYLD